jgi:hypothetical protein
VSRLSPLHGVLDRLAESGALEVVALGGRSSAPAAQQTAIEQPRIVPLADEDDPALIAARRRRLQAALGRSGRASTILGPQEDYSTSKTGVA